jgi:hypothetical protein
MASSATAAAPPPHLEGARTTNLDQMAVLSAKIPSSLVTLRDRTKYVANVVEYCNNAYTNPDKGSIKAAAQDYLSDALQAIAADVEENASNLDRMMALQAREAEALAAKLEALMLRLQLASEVGYRSSSSSTSSTAPPLRDLAQCSSAPQSVVHLTSSH